uniref:Uncharacterized protein n=1 Tax=Trichuris muris TaxID=70415 RepID=A0A5S6R5L8_TRIMR
MNTFHCTLCIVYLLSCVDGRPVKNFTDGSTFPLLNWGRFLFSEDGIVQSLTNMAKDQPVKASPARHRPWDLNSILQGLGVNLRPHDDGAFDIFEFFDPSKMGLCNRKTCGDIYKFFDKVRTSEFLLNLRTLFSLLRDQEGLDLLRTLLTNPNMLRTFLGNGGSIDDGNDYDTDRVTDLDKLDKPEIAFVVDKTKRPGDYDDYYFDGIPNNSNDEIMTINKPVHDVSIKTINGDATLDETEEVGSGTITTMEMTPRAQVDYYAYYYDTNKQNGSGSSPDIVS